MYTSGIYSLLPSVQYNALFNYAFSFTAVGQLCFDDLAKAKLDPSMSYLLILACAIVYT